QKKTSTSVLPLLINPKFIENVILLPLWDSIGIIDRDTQKFTKSITEARTFDSFTHNSPLQDMFAHHNISEINWPLTQSWINYNN
ncbi:14170_t:CDS:1, partial [Rhizophagus irregularis]